MRNLVLLGLLAMLLAFGCAGKSYQAPAAPGGSGQPPAIAVGDSDIAPQPSHSESDSLSSEDVVPVDNSTTPSAGPGNGTALPDASDLLVSNETNEDLISQEDVVGPP